MSILCQVGLHSPEIRSVSYAGAGKTQVEKTCRRCGRKLDAWVEKWKAGL